MKTIYKFVLRSYFGPMILTFFIVMFVLMMNFMWRYIDELVGKGLEVSVMAELMMYAMITLIPMGLPLATLLAAIMTMGNLGENYELLAMKSAGMSLPRIMKPVVIIVFFIAIGSFFVSNNLVPFASKQMSALIYDIRQQKQTIEFQDGLFFNGIDNMSIRVGHQDPNTKLLTDVLIYDNRATNGNMTTTIADSGYIRLSDDKRFLIVTLYDGETYELRRNYQWYDDNQLQRHLFSEQNLTISTSGFDFERTDADLFGGSSTKNIVELEQGIDSLQLVAYNATLRSYEPFLTNNLFTHNTTLAVDSLRHLNKEKQQVIVLDSIASLSIQDKNRLWANAVSSARSSKNMISFDEDHSKEALNQLYMYKVEWHRKWSLPVSIMIFFLIGAPLGAIIRKGGLGIPIVVSVIFFVIYYIISITGEKMAKEGTWETFQGMWISTFILLPIAVFLVYKATHDSNLFNAEIYYSAYNKAKGFFKKVIDKSNGTGKPTPQYSRRGN